MPVHMLFLWRSGSFNAQKGGFTINVMTFACRRQNVGNTLRAINIKCLAHESDVMNLTT
jgi:hypothetical protein